MTRHLWSMGVAELSAAYAAGQADPVNVIAEMEARIARLGPELNAYVALAPDLDAQARDSSARLAAGTPRSALEGVPVAVKDNLSVSGLPAAWGSAVFAGCIRQADEVPIKRLRDAGMIIVGKTNTPEFAVEGYTANRTFGVTRNPWNLELTPGGSSGGAVAAVAAGLAAAGVGTDGGGSIRRPAGHTGLYGLKPGIGSVPRGGGLPQILLDFEVVGPVARSARDLRMIYEVLAGPERSDPLSLPTRQPVTKRDKLRILLVERFGDNPCDPDILASLQEAAGRLRSLGHQLTNGELPLDLEPLNAYWPKIGQIGLAHLVSTVPEMAEKAGPKYLDMAAEGAKIPATELFTALELIRDLRSRASSMFGDWDVILTPCAAAQPWPAEDAFPTEIDGQTVGPRGHAVYTGWVNASGHPGLAMPGRPDPGGLPVGVQIIGDRGSEDLLLQLAEDFEAAGPGWIWPGYANG